MEKVSAQINRIRIQQHQLASRLVNLKNRQDKMERARETRRLVLAGQWMLKLNGGDWSRVAQRLEEAGLLTERDRHLFQASQQADRASSRL
jgi:phage terminase small subunit